MRDGSSPGFALIEAMVALSIVSLCLALLVGFISLGQRFEARSARQSREIQDLVMIDRVIGQLLGQTVPVQGRRSARFEGNEREMRFVAWAPKAFAETEPRRFRIVLDAEGGLLLAWEPGSGSQENGERTETFVPEIRGAFSYQNSDGSWASAATSLAPRLVKLTIDEAFSRHALDLVWPVRVLRPQSCAIDARSSWCRSGG